MPGPCILASLLLTRRFVCRQHRPIPDPDIQEDPLKDEPFGRPKEDEDDQVDDQEDMSSAADDDDRSLEEGREFPRHILETNDAELIQQFGSILEGWFGLVICDEVHFLKNTYSLMHRAVELLQARGKLFLSGTPMVNRPIDLVGTLQLRLRVRRGQPGSV